MLDILITTTSHRVMIYCHVYFDTCHFYILEAVRNNTLLYRLCRRHVSKTVFPSCYTHI